MSTITYTGPVAAPQAKPAATSAGRGWWARLLDAFVEARMRQAEREMAQYRHLHREVFDRAKPQIDHANDGKLPFVR